MLGQGVVVPLLPGYAHQLGASNFKIGFVFSAFSLSTVIFLPLFGRLSDRKGRKPIITAGLFIYACAAGAYMAVSSVNGLVLVRLFQGIAAAMILPVARAYAGEITPTNKTGFAMGFINVSFFGGVASGPLLGGMVKDAFGIYYAFLLMVGVCLFGALLSLLVLPSRRTEAALADQKHQLRKIKSIFDRYIAGLFIVLLGINISTAAVWTYAPLIAQVNLQLPARIIGMMITTSVLTAALFNIPMGYLADRMSKRSLMVIGILILSVTMILLPIVRNAWELWLVCVGVGSGVGVTNPVVNSMAIIWGRKRRILGQTMSFMTTAASLGMFCGPLIVGTLMDLYNPTIGFWSAGSIILANGIAGLIMTAVFPIHIRFCKRIDGSLPIE